LLTKHPFTWRLWQQLRWLVQRWLVHLVIEMGQQWLHLWLGQLGHLERMKQPWLERLH
jgi:hypothetical protein